LLDQNQDQWHHERTDIDIDDLSSSIPLLPTFLRWSKKTTDNGIVLHTRQDLGLLVFSILLYVRAASTLFLIDKLSLPTSTLFVLSPLARCMRLRTCRRIGVAKTEKYTEDVDASTHSDGILWYSNDDSILGCVDIRGKKYNSRTKYHLMCFYLEHIYIYV